MFQIDIDRSGISVVFCALFICAHFLKLNIEPPSCRRLDFSRRRLCQLGVGVLICPDDIWDGSRSWSWIWVRTVLSTNAFQNDPGELIARDKGSFVGLLALLGRKQVFASSGFRHGAAQLRAPLIEMLIDEFCNLGTLLA